MKFLVIKRSDSKADSAAARKQLQQLRELVTNGPLEDVWLLRDGGCAYVTTASEPAAAPSAGVDANAEILTVTNAVAFLEHAAAASPA